MGQREKNLIDKKIKYLFERGYNMWAIIVIYLITTIFFGMMRNEKSIYWFVVTILFQNIVLIILAPYINITEQTVFSLIKEGMLYEICIISLLVGIKKFKITIIDLLFIAYLSFLIKNLLISSADFSLRLISFRQAMIPILGYYVGKNLIITRTGIRKMLKFIVFMAIFVCVFGIFEMVVLKDEFWINIGLHDFLLNKQGEVTNLYNGVTRNFYTWDFGSALRRFISITSDPLASAHFVYLAFLIITTKTLNYKNIEENNKYNIYVLYAGLFFIISVLSFSKAIYIFMALTIFIIAYTGTASRVKKRVIKLISASACIIFGYNILNHYVNATVNTSITNHIDGLVEGFKNASILGNGFGTAGVMTKILGGSDIGTTESYIGTLVQQIGYIGIILFITINIKLLFGLYKKYKKYNENFILLCMIISFGLLIEMIFSESSVSIMGTGIYFILIGVSYSDKYSNIQECNV